MEVGGSKSVANCGRSTYIIPVCFDHFFLFTRMWRVPFRSSLRQASADFRRCRLDRPRLGFNAGRASGHASATGIRNGAPSRQTLDRRMAIARRQRRSLAVPDGKHGDASTCHLHHPELPARLLHGRQPEWLLSIGRSHIVTVCGRLEKAARIVR